MHVSFAKHLDAREHQECPEHVQHPGEATEKRCAGGNEEAAEHEGPDHAEKQHSVLELRRYCKGGEDDGPDEDVIDG